MKTSISVRSELPLLGITDMIKKRLFHSAVIEQKSARKLRCIKCKVYCLGILTVTCCFLFWRSLTLIDDTIKIKEDILIRVKVDCKNSVAVKMNTS